MPEYAFSQTPQLRVEPPSAGFLHFGMRFAVLAKTQQHGHQCNGNEESQHHARGGSDTNEPHGLHRNSEKRQQGGKGGECTEQHRPAHFTHGLFYGSSTFSV